MTDRTGDNEALEAPRRWPGWIEPMVGLAVEPGDRADVVRTKRLLTGALWASIATSIFSVVQYYLLGAGLVSLVLCMPIVAAAISLAAMWRRPSTYPGVMHIVMAGTVVPNTILIVLFGGVFEAAGNTSWSVLALVGAAAIFADRRAHLWLATFVVCVLGAFLISRVVEPLYTVPNRDFFALFNLLVVTIFIYFILYYFVRQSSRLYRQSETLLRNVLPDQVAERLKDSREMIADDFASASILFADIAGFTPMAAAMEPAEVVTILNEVFTDFDGLVAARGLEKIKTIGDSYMVAAGVPVTREDHARMICDLALEMQEHLASDSYGGHQIRMRIGIASGPVMAGIIGTHRFAYDLWGDTVNLASRMEATGTPGRIHIAASTADLVDPWFVCEERGTVDIKGKGPMPTCYLVRRKG